MTKHSLLDEAQDRRYGRDVIQDGLDLCADDTDDDTPAWLKDVLGESGATTRRRRVRDEEEKAMDLDYSPEALDTMSKSLWSRLDEVDELPRFRDEMADEMADLTKALVDQAMDTGALHRRINAVQDAVA